MGKNKSLLIGLAAMLAFFVYGCDQLGINMGNSASFKPQGTIIAKVDDMYVTLEQLNQEIETLNNMSETPEARITTPEQKINYLKEEIIRRYLFYKDAKNKKLDQTPINREMLMNLEIRVLDGQLINKEIGELTVTPKEVEDFYGQYKEQYRQDEERRIREIVLNTEDEAKEVMIELLKGVDFASLAQQRSVGESASKGGDLGYISRGKRGEAFKRFDEIAFSNSLEQGQISNHFKVKDKYYIVKIDAVRGGQIKSLNEVYEDIKKVALFVKQQQKLKELKDNLSKKAKIEIYQEKIK